MFSPTLSCWPRLNVLWEQLVRKSSKLPSPVGTATSRATSTSSMLQLALLGNGVLFALTASLGTTPTLSADNLGLPEPKSSSASHLLVVFVATSLVPCLIPSQSSSEMVLLARVAPLVVPPSKLAVPTLLVSLLMSIAPPTKSQVSSALPSIPFHLK